LAAIEQFVRFEIVANPNSREAVRGHLLARKNAASVYLALADGPLTQDEIGIATRLSQATVSKICRYLHEHGLLLVLPDPSQHRVMRYCYTELEVMLGITSIAREVNRG